MHFHAEALGPAETWIGGANVGEAGARAPSRRKETRPDFRRIGRHRGERRDLNRLPRIARGQLRTHRITAGRQRLLGGAIDDDASLAGIDGQHHRPARLRH